MATIVKQDACRLQISMNDSPRVDELHPKDKTDNNNGIPRIVKRQQGLSQRSTNRKL
jgi:hypothetical protein